MNDFPDPRLSLQASLRRCFPHRDVKVFQGAHDTTRVKFTQGYAEHVIDVETPRTSRPDEIRAHAITVGARMMEVLFPKAHIPCLP